MATRLSFFERLWAAQRHKPEPSKEEPGRGVSRTLPDGTVLWADNKAALDYAYDQLKEKHQ